MRVLKNKSGLTQHLCSMHPHWRPPLDSPFGAAEVIFDELDDEGTNAYRTPLHQQRALAVEHLPWLAPLYVVLQVS